MAQEEGGFTLDNQTFTIRDCDGERAEFKRQVYARSRECKFDANAVAYEIIEKKAEVEREEYKGFVYFASAINTNLVKIGWSKDPVKRLAQLQTGSASPLVLDVAFVGTKEDEKALHKRFAAHREGGEWFRRCEEISAFAKLKRKQEVERRVLLVACQCALDSFWGKTFTSAHAALFAKVKKEDGYSPDPFFDRDFSGYTNANRLPLAVPFEEKELVLIAGIALARAIAPVLRNEEYRGVSMDAVIEVLREWLMIEEDRKECWDIGAEEYIFARWEGERDNDFSAPYWVVEVPLGFDEKLHAAILAMTFAEYPEGAPRHDEIEAEEMMAEYDKEAEEEAALACIHRVAREAEAAPPPPRCRSPRHLAVLRKPSATLNRDGSV